MFAAQAAAAATATASLLPSATFPKFTSWLPSTAVSSPCVCERDAVDIKKTLSIYLVFVQSPLIKYCL